MKDYYGILFDMIINSTVPARECDIDTLYRFADGNKNHPLHKYVSAIGFDRFYKDYRMVEKDVKETIDYYAAG